MASFFDQRVIRLNNQMYYFQLIPNILTVRNQTIVRSLKSSPSQFRLKITKGNQQCDQMKKSISVKAVNGKAAFDKVQLNFNLTTFIPERNIEFHLALIKSQEDGSEAEVGKHIILSTPYIVQFKQNGKKYFNQSVSLGNDYSLSFDLFVDSSRFGLQKFIKQMKDEKKQQKRQSITTLKKYSSNDIAFNQAKSQILSDKQKVQVISSEMKSRFMSPTRKIQRRTSQTSRKLLKKGSSIDRPMADSPKKQAILTSKNSQKQQEQKPKIEVEEKQTKQNQKIKEQQDKKIRAQKQKQAALAESKRIQQQNRLKKQQQDRKARQLRQKKALEEQKKQLQRLRKIEEQKKAEAVILKKQEQQKQKIQIQKKKQQSPLRKQTSKIKQEQENVANLGIQSSKKAISQHIDILSSVQQNNILSTQKKQEQKQSMVVRVKSSANNISQFTFDVNPLFKKTDSGLYDSKGKKMSQSKLHQKSSSNQKNTTTNFALLIGFIVISILLVLNAMTPSRKC